MSIPKKHLVKKYQKFQFIQKKICKFSAAFYHNSISFKKAIVLRHFNL